MRISDTGTTVFPADLQRRQSKRITAQNAVQRREAFVSSDTDTLKQSRTSVLDLYYRMQQTGKSKAEKEETEKEKAEKARTEEPETRTDIIVKPDGSRVLVITTMTGGMETTMSLEIAKPQAGTFRPENAETDKAVEMLQEPCLSSEVQHL